MIGLGYGHVVTGDAVAPEEGETEEIWDGERWIIVKQGKRVDSDSSSISSEPGEISNRMFLVPSPPRVSPNFRLLIFSTQTVRILV